jgi:hypothetical protein
LRQILQERAGNVEEFSQLPLSVTTLKRLLREQLPLVAMRKKKVPLIPEKQAKDKVEEDLYFINP